MSATTANKDLSLLLIDDDVELCSMMQEYFRHAGHQLLCAHEGTTGVHMALEEKPDLVLLDVMLPGLDGISILQKLREHKGLPSSCLPRESNDKIEYVALIPEPMITSPSPSMRMNCLHASERCCAALVSLQAGTNCAIWRPGSTLMCEDG